MDYQTKIIVDANKATRDLEKLEKVFNGNDKAVAKFQKDINRLNKETAAFEKGVKRLTKEQLNNSKVMTAVNKKRKDLSDGYVKANKLITDNINQIKHETIVQKALEAQIKKTTIAMDKQSVATSKAKDKLNGFEKAGIAFSKAWRIMLGVYIAKAFVEQSIEIALAAEKLDLLTKKLVNLTKESDSVGKVIDKAQELGVRFDELGKIVGRFAVASKNAYNVDELLGFTEGLVKSARLVGTTQQELQSGMIQLSQAMSAGRLMGDEFRSVMENLPLLAIELREEFKGNTESLKELASQGVITTEVLGRAMERLRRNMEGIPGLTDTVEAKMAKLSNSWAIFLNKMSKQTFSFVTVTIDAFRGMLDGITGLLDKNQKNSLSDAKKWLSDNVSIINTLQDKLVSVQQKIKESQDKINASPKRFADTGLIKVGQTDEQKKLNKLVGIYQDQLDGIKTQLKELLPTQEKYNGILKENNLREQQRVEIQKNNDFEKQNKAFLKANELINEINESENESLKIKNKFKAIRDKINFALEEETGLETELRLLKFDSYGLELSELEKLANKKDKLTDAQKEAIKFKEWEIDTGIEFRALEKTWAEEEFQEMIKKQDLIAKEEEIQRKANENITKNQIKLASSFDPVFAAHEKYRKSLEAIALLHRVTTPLAIAEAEKAYKKLQKVISENGAESEKLARKLGDQFGNNTKGLFTDLIKRDEDAFSNFTDRIKDMFANALADMLFKSATTNLFGGLADSRGLIGSFFSGIIGSANGNIFGNQGIQAFANGTAFTNTVVSQPTVFPFANGTGLMGEDGPEAIMPLERDSKGRLGVIASGGGSSKQSVVINQSINVNGASDQVLAQVVQIAAQKGAQDGYLAVKRDFENNGSIRNDL